MTNPRFVQLPLLFTGQVARVDTAANLPTLGVVPGAIRFLDDIMQLRIWTGSIWQPFSATTPDPLTVNQLTVNTLTYLNANVVEIGDNILVLNNDVTGVPTENSGLEIERGTSTNAQLLWDETNDYWVAGTIGDLKRIERQAIKEVFFPATNYGQNTGDYRAQRIGSNAQARFTFAIPQDFVSLVSLEIIGIPAASFTTQSFTINSDYAAVGELLTANSQSITFNFSGTLNTLFAMSIAAAFTGLSGGDFCGFEMDHNAIGTNIDYLGIRLRYNN